METTRYFREEELVARVHAGAGARPLSKESAIWSIAARTPVHGRYRHEQRAGQLQAKGDSADHIVSH